MQPLDYDRVSSTRRNVIVITIMLVAILEVLDSTIVNVALPNMMPALGATTEQITWVLTSYVVASAMMLPLTGFLSRRIGHKTLLIVDISAFALFSLLSGLSQSMTQIVVFRFLQGAFGAALIPLSQAILRQSFPPSKQAKAMAIWGIGIMAAPVCGPTLGGFITQIASWRWVFFVNLPICLIGLFLTIWVIPNTVKHKQKIDWLGIGLMFLGIGALQILLDQGNAKNWFSSNFILLLTVISLVGLSLFIIRCRYHPTPAIKLTIFKDRNFALASIIFSIFAGATFGMITLLPIMYETLFGYTAEIAGMTMATLGIGSVMGMLISAPLINKINVKFLLASGLLCSAIGTYFLSTLNLQTPQSLFITINLFIGLGGGLFMVPIATYSLMTVPKADQTEAAGLFSYGRSLGTSFGISLLGTLVSRESQINWHQLGVHITVFSQNLRLWLQQQWLTLDSKHTPGLLARTLHQQAGFIAFLDAFHLLCFVFLLMSVMVLFMKSIKIRDDCQI